MSELVGIAGLYYDVEVILARHKVKGPAGNYGPQQGRASPGTFTSGMW